MDKNILEKIIKTGDINIDDHILEIGPGTGNLTSYILKKDFTNAKLNLAILKKYKLNFKLKLRYIFLKLWCLIKY